MKNGKTIVELAQELERQSAAAQDFIADTTEIRLSEDAETLSIGSDINTGVTDLAHSQIAQRTGIPKRYYDTMRSEAPDLLANNVNRWFDDKSARRMVRTMDGNTRAFLSDRYKRVDNKQIAEVVLPAFLENSSGFEIVSSDITDSKMYIQARLPRIEGEVKVNDPVQAGIIITNSEVGLGAIDIKPMIYRLVCTNGMVTGKVAENGRMRRTHIGSQIQADENIVYGAETLEQMDRALMLQIRDAIKQLSDPALFQILMDQMRQSAESSKIERPVQAVEVLAKAYQLPQAEQDSILETLIRDQDYTRWGLLNAVTEQANNHASYDRAVELETLGGEVLNMNSKVWEQIATAA